MLIGLSGFARSGKDTVGAYLEQRYGYRRARFAAILKEVCARVFGFSSEQIDGALKEVPDPRYPMPGLCPSCGTICSAEALGGDGWYCEACQRLWPACVTPRLAMQTLGTEWGRRLFDGVWVAATLRDIGADERVVLCDVRFPNEAQGIRARGGRVIRLLRGAPESMHPSETSLADRHDCYDAAIDNRGTIVELRAHVDACVRAWGIEAVREAA